MHIPGDPRSVQLRNATTTDSPGRTVCHQAAFPRLPLLEVQHGHRRLACRRTGELSAGEQLFRVLGNEIGVHVAGLELWVRGQVDEELEVGVETNNLRET